MRPKQSSGAAWCLEPKGNSAPSMVSPEVADDNRCACVARGLAWPQPARHQVSFWHFSRKQVFGSSSITGKAIFFQLLVEPRMARARCAPSQSPDLAKLRLRLEASV